MLRICRVERRGDEHEVNSHFFAWCQTLASYPPLFRRWQGGALRPCLAAALESTSEHAIGRALQAACKAHAAALPGASLEEVRAFARGASARIQR